MRKLEEALSEEGWQDLLCWLPSNLDEIAQQTGAMQRKREVRTGELLLRMVLGYAVLDLSMRGVSAWLAQQELASVSDVAVLKRLRKAAPFLRQVLAWLLQQQLPSAQVALPYRVRLGDATALTSPGAKGTDWRVHVGYDVANGAIDTVELTDGHGKEHLERFAAGPGDLLVNDRGYAQAKRIVAVHQAGAHLLVRIGHSAVTLHDADGKRVDPLHWAQRRRRGPGRPPRVEERPVSLAADGTTVQARLIGVRRSKEATEQERKRLRRRAQRTGKPLTERSLAAAAYVFLLTTVPLAVASGTQLAELYRVRWQVELLFKRLKSLLDLDALRAHQPEVVHSYLYGKLIAAVLIERIARQSRAFSPWGLPLQATAADEPLALC